MLQHVYSLGFSLIISSEHADIHVMIILYSTCIIYFDRKKNSVYKKYNISTLTLKFTDHIKLN